MRNAGVRERPHMAASAVMKGENMWRRTSMAIAGIGLCLAMAACDDSVEVEDVDAPAGAAAGASSAAPGGGPTVGVTQQVSSEQLQTMLPEVGDFDGTVVADYPETETTSDLGKAAQGDEDQACVRALQGRSEETVEPAHVWKRTFTAPEGRSLAEVILRAYDQPSVMVRDVDSLRTVTEQCAEWSFEGMPVTTEAVDLPQRGEASHTLMMSFDDGQGQQYLYSTWVSMGYVGTSVAVVATEEVSPEDLTAVVDAVLRKIESQG